MRKVLGVVISLSALSAFTTAAALSESTADKIARGASAGPASIAAGATTFDMDAAGKMTHKPKPADATPGTIYMLRGGS